MEITHTQINMAETKDKIQIAALIIIAVLIVALIMAVVVLAKNAEVISKDPVQFAVDNGIYASCTCQSAVGTTVFEKDMVTIEEMVIQDWTG